MYKIFLKVIKFFLILIFLRWIYLFLEEYIVVLYNDIFENPKFVQSMYIAC